MRMVLRTLYLPDPLWIQLGEEAEKLGLSRSAFIRKILEERKTYELIEVHAPYKLEPNEEE